MVAILHHDRKAEDELLATDALWIKCPAGKDVETVTSVYNKQRAPKGLIALQQDDRVLDPRSKISELARDVTNQLVVVRAVLASDLHKNRMSMDPTRSPLSEITNTQRSISSTGTAKPTPNNKPVSAAPASTAAVAAVPNTTSPNKLPHLDTEQTRAKHNHDQYMSGWEDFLAERYSHLNSVDARTPQQQYTKLHLERERDRTIANE